MKKGQQLLDVLRLAGITGTVVTLNGKQCKLLVALVDAVDNSAVSRADHMYELVAAIKREAA